ncbi:hypothetical protein [Lysinibacillus sp. BW-2-10]|uniref:hypothetical protein n=1 Tax=Lysinibacillus sp. BW-2-10 TaxID=2590030 RepID=UPI00117C1265|nr:hypothetical protein [Lysinibacillus sp. BW-2-10]TSI08694.1 hypothetical protein FJQ64_07025 [Lysinibacillus sp. BW-2-10]
MAFLAMTIVVMGIIATVLYYIGIKVSYSYILYTPSITLSIGVCLYIGKLFTINYPVEGLPIVFDILILSILCAVWIFAIVEAFIIDVFEQGKEMKADAKYLLSQASSYNIRWMMEKIASNRIVAKWIKSFLIKFPLKLEDNRNENNW